MTYSPDPLEACKTRIAACERKLKARSGKREYRNSVPLIQAELDRLRGMRDMIIEGRRANGVQKPETER